MKIQVEIMSHVDISRFQRMKDVVDLSPPYQREGNIWKPETSRALIDSIINGLDIPKLYFETATARRTGTEGLAYQYNVLDGKQRLEAVLAFLADDLPLDDEFIFFENPDVDAKGMTLSCLRLKHPSLAQRFLDFELPIVRVTSDSGDLIEEMFQRLNASTALNAAERRNAVLGTTRDAANKLAEHPLLMECSPIKSARYKYRELAAKFLAIEHQLSTTEKIIDTKANTLIKLFYATRGPSPEIDLATMNVYGTRVSKTLGKMRNVFEKDDRLLVSIGTVVVYYIAFRSQYFEELVTRDALLEFEEARKRATLMGENNTEYNRPANVRLREYNGKVQSTNDGKALTRRAEILSNFVIKRTGPKPLAGLDEMPDEDLVEENESDEQ